MRINERALLAIRLMKVLGFLSTDALCGIQKKLRAAAQHLPIVVLYYLLKFLDQLHLDK
jgi:hypothetical protein